MNPNDCTSPQSQPRILSVSENSREISKLKPKIRIVHIFAPEIIETDPSNFRELVQRLTGNPSKIVERRKKKKNKKALPVNEEAKTRCKQEDVGVKRELDRDEDEKELWVESNSGGGFLREFGEIDGFFQGLGDLPLLTLTSSHGDVLIGDETV